MSGPNELDERIPPGQQLVSPGKWPIIGEKTPRSSAEPWTLSIGPPEAPLRILTLDELAGFKTSRVTLDIHCVTRWSRLDVPFAGVRLADLLSDLPVPASARFVSFISRSEKNHSTSLPLHTALELGTLIATEAEGQPLPTEHGGPIRNIVPGRYFYKSVKWLERIELLTEDRLGTWEADSGYHNNADPWREERYMAPTIDKRTAARLIESRDFSNCDLRSIDCSRRELPQLQAQGALLRDSNFRNANLQGADFSRANLSNAHFERANLRGVCFRDADLEGANLSGADLSGADLTGASLIGASFCQLEPNGERLGATFDERTQIPPSLRTPLTPTQIEYLSQHLDRH